MNWNHHSTDRSIWLSSVASALRSPWMSGAQRYLQTNGNFFFPHPYFFGEERILPFTYGYVMPKLDYFGDTFSRASQYEMSY